MSEFAIRVSAVLFIGNSILLARHKRSKQEYFVLPGGRVEYGESLEEALQRELYEEAGIRPSLDRLLFVWDYLTRTRHIVNVCFLVTGVEHFEGKKTHEEVLQAVELVQISALNYIDLRPPMNSSIQRVFDSYGQGPTYLGKFVG